MSSTISEIRQFPVVLPESCDDGKEMYKKAWCTWKFVVLLIWTNNPGQKSLGQYCNIHIFLSFLGSLLKQCIVFEIFLQFSLPPPPTPYTKLKLGKNAAYTRPTLFVGWGERLDLCELENAPETQKCTKTFVHDCSAFLSFSLPSLSSLLTLTRFTVIWKPWTCIRDFNLSWHCRLVRCLLCGRLRFRFPGVTSNPGLEFFPFRVIN